MPKSLISIGDFSKDEILHILDVAKEFEKNREQNFLAGKVIACLFFEPSTRTRLSFEAAVNRLGARVIGFPDSRNTSVSKGETLEDTIRIVSNYVDMIVMRHPMEEPPKSLPRCRRCLLSMQVTVPTSILPRRCSTCIRYCRLRAGSTALP